MSITEGRVNMLNLAGICRALIVVAATAGSTLAQARELSADERVAAQRAIEQVYWSHRIWPGENPGPKPPLSAVMSDDAIRAKVEDYLRKSNALERYWQRPVTADQLQAELDRMAKNTRDGAMLQELFRALGNDAFVIAETLARQTLVDRLIRNWYATDTRFHGELKSQAESALAACADTACMKTMGGEHRETTLESGEERTFDAWWDAARDAASPAIEPKPATFAVPDVPLAVCANDTWTPTPVGAPDIRAYQSEVWTGTEMIIWGGAGLNTGGRYSPATDTWTSTSTGANVPTGRSLHTAVWTGTEMIVWGGNGSSGVLNTGGRYNPSTDAWTATSTGANVPAARQVHTAVWTGTAMIVWGGSDASNYLNSGGRYTPSSNTWATTSTGTNVPSARSYHTAAWSGTVMIVWGGDTSSGSTNTGGRYDPSTDAWTTTTTTGAPAARNSHTAVWTGTVMIVWGGAGENTGGRYDPSTDAWVATSTGANVPTARYDHSAVWTGTVMIVWGGQGGSAVFNTGGRYNPSTNSWTATSTGANVPLARSRHSTVWTGTEMIVWGGSNTGGSTFVTGGRYNPSSNTWVATATGSSIPTSRQQHSAVWTGTEMIVWGGYVDGPTFNNTGGRYNPSTSSWTATSTGANVPVPRYRHTAVWTGTEMIVWGGSSGVPVQNTGGRYNPLTDSWTETSTGANVPIPRWFHTAIWTGTEMIVWGGHNGTDMVNDGGRYNPTTDAWAATSTGLNVPAARSSHTAVWTGTEMIVWGGGDGFGPRYDGRRYNPATNAWSLLSEVNVPFARQDHTAVWTGTEMIVWGGSGNFGRLNDGGRYNPAADAWAAVSTGAGVPTARRDHNAEWTGTEMIAWGGEGVSTTNTGGRYNPATNSWTATSTGVNTPGARTYHTGIWTGTQMIVWGGSPTTSTGGIYCACPNGAIYYRDADGDGFGDPGKPSPSCDGSLTAGVVNDHSDCDDTRALVHPGGVEFCNGLDDDCNGAIDDGSALGAEPSVSASKSGVTASFDWPAIAGATAYDTLRGRILDWPVGSNPATEACFDDGAGTSVSDGTVPAAGDGYWYVVRGENACGNGGYGSQESQGVPTAPRLSGTCP